MPVHGRSNPRPPARKSADARAGPDPAASASPPVRRAAVAQTPGSELPDIGTPASHDAVADRRVQDRADGGAQLRDAGQIVDDPEITEYLQSLGMRAREPGARGRASLHVLRGQGQRHQRLRAAGRLHRRQCRPGHRDAQRSELAGVLAHEIAHVTQRHIARSIQNAGRANLASMAAMLAAILIGATTGLPSDALDRRRHRGPGPRGAAARSTSRARTRARRTASASASSSPRDSIPVGMPDFFWTMQQRSGGAGRNIPDLLRSHPVTTERIAETRDRATRMPRSNAPDSTSYALIRERLQLRRCRRKGPVAGAVPGRAQRRPSFHRSRAVRPRAGADARRRARGGDSRCWKRCATGGRT